MYDNIKILKIRGAREKDPWFTVVLKGPGSAFSIDPLILVTTVAVKWKWRGFVYGFWFFLKPFSYNWRKDVSI